MHSTGPASRSRPAWSGRSGLTRFFSSRPAPAMSEIQNPQTAKGYKPVSLPMPAKAAQEDSKANSLWLSGSRAFFKDQRANKVGDLLTVQAFGSTQGLGVPGVVDGHAGHLEPGMQFPS